MSRPGAVPAAYCLLAILLQVPAGCSRDEAPPSTTPAAADTIVVYAAGIEVPGFAERVAAFSAATGIAVVLEQANGAQLVDAVIDHAGDPPADVLLTDGVYEAFRAGSEGGLRPLAAEIPEASVPAALRDPDGTWVAVAFEPTVIAYDAERVPTAALDGWESLADAAFSGQVCLSSSTLPGNRTLLATLIGDLGVRPAEILVRKWLQNLAEPVYSSQAELVAAFAAGDCAAAIVTLEALAGIRDEASRDVGHIVPGPAVGDIIAAGVSRHAVRPEAANRFVAWLVETSALGDASAAEGMPVRNVAIGGWLAEDAMALARRAGYP